MEGARSSLGSWSMYRVVRGELNLKKTEPQQGSADAAPRRKVHHASSKGDVMVHR